MKKRRTNYKGYTLVELLVVMLISGILLSMGAVEYGTATSESKIQSFHSSVLTALSGAESYRQKYGEYPDTNTFNALLRDQRYFSIPPKNPYTGKTLQATTATEAKNTLGYFYYSLTPDGNIKVETNPPLDIDVAQMEEPEKGTTSTYSVSFTVVDGNGSPISGAQIMINGKTLTTDAQGKATTALAAGTYFYSATKTGYNFVNGSLTVSGDISRTITMNSSSFTVTVIVKNESGDPITGAYVTGIGSGGQTTDAEGKATFTGISAGTYNIVATATGYEQTSLAVTVKSNQQVRITMPKLRLYTVNVLVTDIDGNPLQGAVIKGIGSGGVTGSDGRATIANVLAGSYTITVEATNYDQQQKTIVVNSNQDVSFALVPSKFTVSISVMDADKGTAVTGASVSGIGADSKVTDDSGNVAFENVLSGDYTINVSAPNYASTSKSISVSKSANSFTVYLSRLKGSVTITVKNSSSGAVISNANVEIVGFGSSYTDGTGKAVFSNVPYGSYSVNASALGYNAATTTLNVSAASQSLEITLEQPKYTVTVNVKDQNGNPISGATVSGLGTAKTTDTNGTAVFQDITYGSYTISVSAYGYYDASTTKVISSNDTINISLAALPKGNVQINVKDGDNGGAPFAGATVQLKDLNGKVVASAVSDSQGKAILSGIVNGLYTVVASYDWRYGTSTMDIAVNGNGIYDITLSKLKATVTVKLTDASGISPSGVSVTGIGSGGTTDWQGKITFSNIPYGQYNISVSSQYHSPTSMSVTVNSPSQTVSIPINRNKVTVTVHVQDSRSGASLSGASVSGIGSGGTTDGNGNITFSNIWAKSYTIQVNPNSPDYKNKSESVNITDSRTITISVDQVDRLTFRVMYERYVPEVGASFPVPLAYGSVTLIGPQTYYGTTDANGYITFNNITYGSYTVRVAFTYKTASGETRDVVKDLGPYSYNGGIVNWGTLPTIYP